MDILRYHARAQVVTDMVMYSFCTLVNDFARYERMVESFQRLGFDAGDCEFLYIDNTVANQADAFSGYNLLLRKASGRYIILCHQDIAGLDDDRETLDRLLSQLSGQDPHWGLCGNAGVDGQGRRFIRISDPYSSDQSTGAPFLAMSSAWMKISSSSVTRPIWHCHGICRAITGTELTYA